MKVFRDAFDAFMGLALRLILGSFMFGVALVLLIFLIEAKVDRDLKKYLTWLAIVALAIVALNLTGCCRKPVTSPVPVVPDGTTVLVMGSWPDKAIGMTTCSVDNKPVILLRDIRWDSLSLAISLSHEHQHVRQLSKDCRATLARYKADRAFMVKLELEAYCEDSRFAVSIGVPEALAEKRLRSLMKSQYGVENPVCLPP